MLLRLSLQQRFQAECDVPVLTRGGCSLDRRAFREALDQCMDQLLLQPMRRFGIDHRSRPPLDQTNGGRMEVAQMPHHHRPRVPPTSGGGDRERRSGQSGAILNQVRGRQPDRPPAARPIGSHVQALACPERHDLARSDRDAAPDRCGSLAPRQRNKDRVGRYGDKGDPRQLLVGSRQSQAEQGDLGQPRPKLAGTGDERARQPSSRMAAAKSSASLNTDVTLLGIVTPALLLPNQGCRV